MIVRAQARKEKESSLPYRTCGYCGQEVRLVGGLLVAGRRIEGGTVCPVCNVSIPVGGRGSNVTEVKDEQQCTTT